MFALIIKADKGAVSQDLGLTTGSPNSSINRDLTLCYVFSVGGFYVVLTDHGVLEGGVDLGMSEEMLNLLNGHSLINCLGGEGTAEFVGVHFVKAQFLSQIP